MIELRENSQKYVKNAKIFNILLPSKVEVFWSWHNLDKMRFYKKNGKVSLGGSREFWLTRDNIIILSILNMPTLRPPMNEFFTVNACYG